MQLNLLKDRPAMTLVELLVAMGLMTTVLAALIGVAVSLLSYTSSARRLLEANSLAREGLSLVEARYRYNKKKSLPFDEGLKSTAADKAKVQGVISWADFVFTLVDPTDSTADDGSLKLDSDGFYRPQASGVSSTEFRRLITIKAICLDSSSGTDEIKACDESSPASSNKIGIKVKSEVFWLEFGGVEESTYFELDLYQ